MVNVFLISLPVEVCVLAKSSWKVLLYLKFAWEFSVPPTGNHSERSAETCDLAAGRVV